MGATRRAPRAGAAALFVVGLSAAVAEAGERPAITPKIDPVALRAHVRFLADDLLEGREAGTRGHEIAARYVASEFEALGLEPGGPDGSYLQKVPLRRATLVADSSRLILSSPGKETRELRPAKDYVAAPSALREASGVKASVVYVGFGLTAPGRKHDDYAKVDARGKIVALLMGAPASFPTDERAYYSSRLLKAENAAAHGAKGVLYLLSPEEEQRFPFPRVVEAMAGGAVAWLQADGSPHGSIPGLGGAAVLSREGAEALFVGSQKALDQAFKDAAAGKTQSFALPVEVELQSRSQHAALSSPNVLGILRGSDPALAKEYVVVSAHLDHLGIGAGRDGDTIYNGALDNASGTAAIIEMARAFALQPKRPRRSLVFAAVTAEEKGLLGAEYFAANGTVPIADVVANLNVDMPLTLFPLKDVVAFGAEHSSLGKIVTESAGRLGIEVSPDPFPDEVIFIRSDHYPFVQKGIPALMLCSGMKSADPKIEGNAVFGKWLATVYHSPKDDSGQALDYAATAKITQLYYLVADRVADETKRPTWNEGDFFGTRFGRK